MGEAASEMKTRVEHLKTQGVDMLSSNWLLGATVYTICKALQVSYVFRFALVHHALEQKDGVDQYDGIVIDSVSSSPLFWNAPTY